MVFAPLPTTEQPACCLYDVSNTPPEYIKVSGQDSSARAEGGAYTWTYVKGILWAVQNGTMSTDLPIRETWTSDYPCHTFIHGIRVALKYSDIDQVASHYINEGDDNESPTNFVTYSVFCPGQIG